MKPAQMVHTVPVHVAQALVPALELGPPVTPMARQVSPMVSPMATPIGTSAQVRTETSPFFPEPTPLSALSTTYGAPANLAGWESGDTSFTGAEYDSGAVQPAGTGGNQFNALLESL